MTSESGRYRPLDQRERIRVLDALRGFAILGILMINIRVFSGYSYVLQDVRNQVLLPEYDHIFNWIHISFFSGKFYTLFSLLFGIGFAIQLIRSSSANRSFSSFFSRRLFVLLLIGMVHLWGIWFSDILVLYAICGYLLVLFRGLSNRALLLSVVFLLLISGLHDWYIHVTDGGYTNTLYQMISERWKSADLPRASSEQVTFQVQDMALVFREGSWSTVLSFNALGPLLRAYFISYDGRLIKILAVFVLGFWVGRKIMLSNLHEKTSFLVKVAVLGWIIGLPLNILYGMEYFKGAEDPQIVFAGGVLVLLGYITLAVAYASTFALLYRTRIRKLLDLLFSSVGKMALTNYILQSLIGIFLFYSIGLGLGEHLGSTLMTIAVFIIFGFQSLVSNLWLSFFRFGPLEWIWRILTYGQYIKLRR
ncbi:MAG: DUF418 domain-containing protein [Marinilabilia sp.]